MARAILLVLDSFGIGAAPDAELFGDLGSNTLGHIAAMCAMGQCNHRGRLGPLQVPFMNALGLGRAAKHAAGQTPVGLPHVAEPMGWFGACTEQSTGKDTPSGHWEIAGVPVFFDWGYFQPNYPSFPEDLISNLVRRCDLSGVLGNEAASGTEIIARLGAEHVATRKPIVYTSSDSVFQIAAHEHVFELERLYYLCQVARELVDDYNIGRVIARPFVGNDPNYVRTGNRRDFATPPPSPTLLDILEKAGREVVSIGKIADIFAHRGLTKKVKATGNMALFSATLEEVKALPNGGLVFTNFVDFDSIYGHRRDAAGYANALEDFDSRLVELQGILQPDDLVILTADHGCDPTWQGTDHTREYVPVLAFGPKVDGRDLGLRDTFADIGQSVAHHLNISLSFGTAFQANES